MRTIKERNVALIYAFSLLTCGIYWVYWMVATKRDINSRGGDIPTTWINLVPFAGFYYMYKYAECFSSQVKKDNNSMLYFALFSFLTPVMPIIVQPGLNKLALQQQKPQAVPVKKAA